MFLHVKQMFLLYLFNCCKPFIAGCIAHICEYQERYKIFRFVAFLKVQRTYTTACLDRKQAGLLSPGRQNNKNVSVYMYTSHPNEARVQHMRGTAVHLYKHLRLFFKKRNNVYFIPASWTESAHQPVIFICGQNIKKSSIVSSQSRFFSMFI